MTFIRTDTVWALLVSLLLWLGHGQVATADAIDLSDPNAPPAPTQELTQAPLSPAPEQSPLGSYNMVDPFGPDPFDFGVVGYQPRFTTWIGAVLLQRSTPKGHGFLLSDDDGDDLPSAGDSAFVNTHDYRFGVKGGIDVNAVWHGEKADLDFRYFGIDSMISDTDFSPESGEVLLPFRSLFNLPAAFVTTAYYSNLLSFETNLRQNVSQRVTLSAGFRYLSLREHIDTLVGVPDAVVPPTFVQLSATNSLFGAQIGVDGILWQGGKRLRLESWIKVGVYGNTAENHLLHSSSLFQTPVVQSFGSHKGQAAFVGDLMLTGVYQINDAWAWRVGYQLLWISGVALASGQVGTVDPFSGAPPTVNTSDTLFLHGAVTSLQFAY